MLKPDLVLGKERKYKFEYLSSINDLKASKNILNNKTSKGVYCVVAVVCNNKKLGVKEAADPKDRDNDKYSVKNINRIVNELSKKNLNEKNHRLLYIGKAGGKEGLKQRLTQYIESLNRVPNAANNPTNNGKYYKGHRGGRAIWQIKDCSKLHIYTYETRNIDPKKIEKYLIDVYGIDKLLNMRR